MKLTTHETSPEKRENLLTYLESIGFTCEVTFDEEGVLSLDTCDDKIVRVQDIFLSTGVRVRQKEDEGVLVVQDEPIATKDYVHIVDEIIRKKAAEYGYDSIVSACSYSTSAVPRFNREGNAFGEWRDALWIKCFELAAEAEATGEWPDPDTAVALLPTFESVLAKQEVLDNS